MSLLARVHIGGFLHGSSSCEFPNPWFFSVPPLTTLQCFSGNSDISNFRFMVELQSLWRSRLGFVTTWRHYQRYPLYIQGLVEEGCRHSARRWAKRRV